MHLLVAEIVVVGVVAFLTAIFSAVAGLGGGIILLAVIAQFHAPATAIPIHGSIQMVSNGWRSALLRSGINWPAVGYGSVLVLPGTALGVIFATSVPATATRLILGVFILIVAWRPSLLRWDRPGRTNRSLIPVGAASGFLSASIGASGPFTSPFYRAVTASHRAFVATAGTTQVLSHGGKLVGFGLEGFDFLAHRDVIAVSIACVIGGTVVGTRLLSRTDERRLTQLFRLVLTVLAVRLIINAML